jgi:hypothetical protein
LALICLDLNTTPTFFDQLARIAEENAICGATLNAPFVLNTYPLKDGLNDSILPEL